MSLLSGKILDLGLKSLCNFFDYDSDPEIQTIYTFQPIIAPLTNPTLIAQVHLLLDTYSRPIPVIALFDIGATAIILHPRL